MIALLRQLLAAILSLVLAAPLCACTFDPVGNRTQKTSTIPGYPGGLLVASLFISQGLTSLFHFLPF
jgi:hypothetical protein